MSARLVLRRTSTSVGPPCRLAKGELWMNVAGATQPLFKYATIAAVVLLLPQAAMAKKDKRDKKGGSPESANACVEKYKSGLDNEQAGHLKQARELFIGCAKASCGSPLRDECTTRFT